MVVLKALARLRANDTLCAARIAVHHTVGSSFDLEVAAWLMNVRLVPV